MFEIIDYAGNTYTAYGTHVDDRGIVQFILCDSDGQFYVTNTEDGYYRKSKPICEKMFEGLENMIN